MPAHETLRSWLAAYPRSHPQAHHGWIHGAGIVLAWLGVLGLLLPLTIQPIHGPALSISLTVIMAVTVYAALFALPLAIANGIVLGMLLVPWVLWSRAGGDPTLPAGLLLLAGFLLLAIGQGPDRSAGKRIGNTLIAFNSLPRGLYWLLSGGPR